jgi:hypothetical protein
VQRDIDMCVYYQGLVSLMIYTGGGIFIGKNDAEIERCYQLLISPFVNTKGFTHPAFRMTNEGDLNDYLGVKVTRLPNGRIKFLQPHLIDQIIADMDFNDRTTSIATLASSTHRVLRDHHGAAFEEEWQYRSIIGKLNFLKKSTRPDLAYSMHQCARISSDPRASHAAVVKRIVGYLVGTRDKGIVLNPTKHSFDCWVDADFVGNWD